MSRKPWTSEGHEAIMLSLYTVMQANLGPAAQAEIIREMKARGYDVTWNALRTVTMVKWDEIRDDLFEAILSVNPPLQKEQQDRIVAMMNKRGHQIGWNAIRTWPPPSPHRTTKFIKTVRVTQTTMPGRRTLQNWDAETHEAVLLALVEYMKPTGSDWSAVVASLHAKGYTFTEGALIMASKQPTTWDHDAHLALLQAVMAEAPPTPAQWDGILARVAKKGYSYTASAAM
ncbi:hypothetical protein VTK26DRAFT_7535 [Humicola hyalothermophila]